MFNRSPYVGGYTTYQQPVMQYQPQYMGQQQPQIIIIKKGWGLIQASNPFYQKMKKELILWVKYSYLYIKN